MNPSEGSQTCTLKAAWVVASVRAIFFSFLITDVGYDDRFIQLGHKVTLWPETHS